MDLNKFKQLPIMGIVRGITCDNLKPLLDTVINSGLKTLEITLNTPDAFSLIKQAKQIVGDNICLGAGTVISVDQARVAVNSGATFLVSPVCQPELASYCKENSIAFFPGAFTPSEIFKAWELGAAMVKVFPAKFFGPDYFKEIKAPLQDIELLACGGVNSDNIDSFFVNRASAVAFGGSIFSKDLMEKGEWSTIQKNIEKLIEAYQIKTRRLV